MRTETSVEIDKPITEVFDYTHTHLAEWSIIVVEDEIIDKKPEVVGTTFRVVTEDRGCRMDFDGVVTRHDPPTVHSVVMTGKQFDMEVDYLFEDLSGRTRVTQISSVTGKGFVKVMFVVFGWLMKRGGCKAQEKELASLKRLLEEGPKPAES